MKYFTPELFELCNRPDFETAFQASLSWEKAVAQYETACNVWLGAAPAGLRKLLTNFSGHDAKIVSRNRVGDTLLSLFVVEESKLWTLNYQILSEPVTTPPRDEAKRWSPPGSRLWLYDELSQVAAGRYRHEILLSDGSTLSIEFDQVSVKSKPLGKPTEASPKYDFKLEFTLSGRNLHAAFRQATLVPRQPAGATPRPKPASVRRGSKSAKKKVTK